MNSEQRFQASKFLSLVLRHEPAKAFMQLDEAGWVDVNKLLAGCARAGHALTQENLHEIVRMNSKKRFEFSADGMRIRASQGHSVEVELGYEPSAPPELLYHGTAVQNLEVIRQEGLRKGKRHHVHLSASADTAVKVGTRHGKPVIIQVLSGEMNRQGYAFFVSTNNVWLVDEVPARFLRISL